MLKKDPALYSAGCRLFGAWRNALTAAGLQYKEVMHKPQPSIRKKWNRASIIEEIRGLNQLGAPLNSNHLQKNNRLLYQAVVRHFGGLAQVVAAAGLDYSRIRKRNPMRSWTKNAVVAEIIRRNEEGLSIRRGIVYSHDPGLYSAARRFFGTNGWAKARSLAGFDPNEPRPDQIWDEKTVVAEILKLYADGVPLNVGALQGTSYSYILGAARTVFGSWAKAVRASGLSYARIRKKRYGWWTKPRVVMCIRNLEKRGVRLSLQSIRTTHVALMSAALAEFGSWAEAVEAAGISYRKHCRVWSTKAWLRSLRDSEYAALIENAKGHAKRRRAKK